MKKILAMIKDEIPADYIASPKEAAQMVYHVAEAPGYMTGQIVTFLEDGIKF